jgi:hypothetical protein
MTETANNINKPPAALLKAVETQATGTKTKLSHVQPAGKQMLLSEVRKEAPQSKSTAATAAAGQRTTTLLLRPAKTENKRDLLSQVRTQGPCKGPKLHHVAAPIMKQDIMSEVRRNKDHKPPKQSAIVKNKEFVQKNVTSQGMDLAKQHLKHVQPAGKQELLSGIRVEGKDVKKRLSHVEEPPAGK